MDLKIEELYRLFGSHKALSGLSTEVSDIRTLAIVGPSGGGKSTLLRVMAGLEQVDSGRIWINGEELPRDADGLLRHRRKIGTVFQAFNLFPHLTALRNITLPLEKVHQLSATEAVTVAERLLERFGLGEHQGKRPAELSGGQRQRVAIARAVSANPRLVLFDEPTSALDPEMTYEVLAMIRELTLGGMDSILVTHEMGFARQAADWMIVVADGTVVESGRPEKVLSEPESAVGQRFLRRVRDLSECPVL